MRFICTPTKGKDLKTGDLFSTLGDEYWNGTRDHLAVGERVYIRTDNPPDIDPDGMEETFFRIEVERDAEGVAVV